MSPFQVPNGPFTIDDVMDAIRKQIVEPHEPQAEQSSARVVDGSDQSELAATLDELTRLASLEVTYRIRSHRPVLGRILDAIKHAIHWGSRPYTDMIRERQAAFNVAVTRALAAIATDIQRLNRLESEQSGLGLNQQRLENAQIGLDEKQMVLEKDLARFETGQNQLLGMVRRLDGDYKRLEAIRNQLQTEKTRLEENQIRLEARQSKVEESQTLLDQKQAGIETRQTEFDINQSRMEHGQRRLFGRHALKPFFSSVPAEKRLEALERTRGKSIDIVHSQERYAELFEGAPGPVLDIGCGRGELLGILHARGIACRGVEIDPLMAEIARSKGVEVDEIDGLEALRRAEPAGIGGLFAAQVVEHLFPGELGELLMLARQKLAPGARIVLETVNVSSPAAMSKNYYRDMDHKLPLHPEYLKLLLEMSGFENVELHYAGPFSAAERLPDMPPADEIGIQPQARRALQGLVDQLNERIYGMQDYYVVARQAEGIETGNS